MSWIWRVPLLSQLRERRASIDAAVITFAGIVVVLILSSGTTDTTDDATRSFDAGAVGILVIAGAVLLWGNRAPFVVVLLVFALTAMWYLIGYQNPIINAPAQVAYFMVGRWGDRRRQIGSIAITAVAIVLVFTASEIDEPLRAMVGPIGWPAVAVLFGGIVRASADRTVAERETVADRRVAEERMRIARDLHDLLAHTVSVMMVQAGVADDTLERSPARARDAIRSIRSAGGEAVDEMHAMITVLREGDDVTGLDPSPGLHRLNELLDAAQRAGVNVHSSVDPAADDVSPMIGLTVYRIVQEGLTNVLRHADAGQVWLTIGVAKGQVHVELRDNGRGMARRGGRPSSPSSSSVDDDGPHTGSAARTPGFGLRGMEERVEALGGEFTHGDAPEGGYVVHATLSLVARQGSAA